MPIQLASSTAAPAESNALRLVRALVADLRDRSERLTMLERRMLEMVGSPLLAFVDHIGVPASELSRSALIAAGFVEAASHPVDAEVFKHPTLALPAIFRLASGRPRVALSVDDVTDFLVACGRWVEEVRVEGDPFGGLRRARLAESPGHELWVVERKGARGFTPRAANSREISAAMRTREVFRRRPRYVAAGDDAAEVERMGRCSSLIQHGRAELGPSRAAAFFVEAEIERFVRRNRAGRILDSRLRALGLGFPHVDHLVYRSSRHRLRGLVRIFETLGFERTRQLSAERYGAQILTHPELGFSVVCETDLLPEERDVDLGFECLRQAETLGLIERYALLHGESILGAGVHRLAVAVELDRARAILASDGVETREPHCDSAARREAATVPEPWAPDADRVALAIARGALDPSRAIELTSQGTPGSELGLVERLDAERSFDADTLAAAVRFGSRQRAKIRDHGMN